MGFFDRAKSSLSERFGADETVRRGRFGAREGDEVEEEVLEESLHSEPRPKRARPKLPREPKQSRRSQSEEPEELSDEAFDFDDGRGGYANEIESSEPEVVDTSAITKLAKDEGQSVEEILKSMRIESTFQIDDDILFVDEALASKEFATQAPYGYDMGEVDFFLGMTQRSIAHYVKLLRARNNDVARLASRISDLMVELNNIRLNAEIANGINIMASGGDDDALAVDLQEAKLKLRRLEEELRGLRSNGAPQEVDQSELERLRNELAAARRSRDGHEAEAQDLRAHLVLIEEEYDIQVFSERGELQTPAQEGYESYEEQRNGQFQSVEGIDSRAESELYAEESSYQKVGRDHWLPGYDAEEGLPEVSQEEEGLPDGSFEFFEEESLEDLSLDSFELDGGGFAQSDGEFKDSAFSPDPYQNIDEFIENNLDGFPEDNSSGPLDDTLDGEDPDDDGFSYSFERKI